MKKIVTRVLTGVMAFGLVVGVATPATGVDAAKKKKKAAKFAVTAPSGKTAYVAKGKKIKLTATKKATFTSKNKKIAQVTSKGVVKGVKPGKTVITAKSGKNKKTIKVVVKKDAVKKITFEQKTVNLATGASKKVKAKVTGSKKSCKKVKYTSSKTKIASVSAAGKVKARKEGSVTITATSVDGSKVKASYKLNIGAGIDSVSRLSSRQIRVTLTAAKALTKDDFKVQYKSTPTGNYQVSAPIKEIQTNNNKVYDLTFKDTVYLDSYIKVTIQKLSYNKTVETCLTENAISHYKTSDTKKIVTGRKGGKYSSSWYLDDYSTTSGEIIYSVSGLPSGLKAYYSEDKTWVRVKGTYANVENGTTAVLTGTDEKGKTFKKSYEFYVGDENTMVGKALDMKEFTYRGTPDPEDPNTINYSGFLPYDIDDLDFYVVGGTGSRTYEISGMPEEFGTMDSNGYFKRTGTVTQTNAGDYQVTITVKDQAGHSVQLPFTLKLEDGVEITGKITDGEGNPLPNAYYRLEGKYNEYGKRDFSGYAYTKKDGTYKLRVFAGEQCQEYVSTYSYDGMYSLREDVSYTASQTKDFKLPLYKVSIGNIGADIESASFNWSIIDEFGSSDYYGQSEEVETDATYGKTKRYYYLENGTYSIDEYYTDEYYDDEDDSSSNIYYNLRTTVKDGDSTTYKYYMATGSFTVNNASLTFTPTLQQVK